MSDAYLVHPVSRFKAKVSDGVIRETKTTRLVFRPEIVDNQSDPHATVHGRLIHQRRNSDKEPWKDDVAFALATLKGNQAVLLNLDAEATRKLYQELDQLYQIPIQWTSGEPLRYKVVDPDECYIATGRERELIQQLLVQEGEGFWDHVEQLAPGLIDAVALKRHQEARERVVAEFAQHLEANDWSEPRWQEFFETNTWIFGHNLLFQFLKSVGSEVHVGGKTMSGRGGQDVDFLMNTEGDARFTVLVDIKRPDTLLVKESLYRNSVHDLGADLIGSVSQVQSYCRRWVIEGSVQQANREFLRDQSIYTYEPRGIVVAGHCHQLKTEDKRATFELYRRNLLNPTVITYDELYARAYFTVGRATQAALEFDPSVPRKYQD